MYNEQGHGSRRGADWALKQWHLCIIYFWNPCWSWFKFVDCLHEIVSNTSTSICKNMENKKNLRSAKILLSQWVRCFGRPSAVSSCCFASCSTVQHNFHWADNVASATTPNGDKHHGHSQASSWRQSHTAFQLLNETQRIVPGVMHPFISSGSRSVLGLQCWFKMWCCGSHWQGCSIHTRESQLLINQNFARQWNEASRVQRDIQIQCLLWSCTCKQYVPFEFWITMEFLHLCHWSHWILFGTL